MTVRTWLYSRMVNSAPLADRLGGENPRIYAKKSMTSNKVDHPFIVYKLGFSANEDIAESMPDGKDVHRQFVQIWIHDYTDVDSADYMQIDEVALLVKTALHGQSSPEDGVIYCKYIETSQDLNDETLNTVVKYMRFQITTKEVQ